MLNIALALDIMGSWFLPGFGFLRRGRYARAIVLFMIIEGTALFGLLLHGSVVFPILDVSGGGVISLLTFLIQLGNGAISLLCLVAGSLSDMMGVRGLRAGQMVRFFTGYPSDALFDLGSFYLLVSGAMNYFVVTNFYDRYKAGGKGSRARL